MRIYFTRHGQTDCNIQGIIQGQKDYPLNDWGRKEARRLAKRLAYIHFEEMWSSSLSRATETAEIVAALHSHLQVQTDPLLMERNLGSMEDKRWHRGYHAPADAETPEALQDRGRRWLKSFLKDRSEMVESDKNVLVMSHGAYLGMMLRILLAPSRDWHFDVAEGVDLHASCGNTMIMLVEIHKGTGKTRWDGTIWSWGDNSHLDDLKEPHERETQLADDVK